MLETFAIALLIAQGQMLDRISVIAGTHAIKASDIERDIRVTAFLNNQQPDFGAESRKQAASRLIDQALIRDQVRTGDFPMASIAEANHLLEQTRQERLGNASADAFQTVLHQYGITENELRDRLLWQLTVLRFIDARFRPAVDENDPKPAAEQIDKLMNAWLDEQRKNTRIVYVEKSLQ